MYTWQKQGKIVLIKPEMHNKSMLWNIGHASVWILNWVYNFVASKYFLVATATSRVCRGNCNSAVSGVCLRQNWSQARTTDPTGLIQQIMWIMNVFGGIRLYFYRNLRFSRVTRRPLCLRWTNNLFCQISKLRVELAIRLHLVYGVAFVIVCCAHPKHLHIFNMIDCFRGVLWGWFAFVPLSCNCNSNHIFVLRFRFW